ncbi:MAG TPA: hypothetical protein PLU36_05525 [Chitinophagaceae bacterium]|nr:hypothetical protein [Chitinophagaceae bacterium]MCC6634208.1 hypothetical protein [Chitinophagaceae bacterium]HMZ46244.1 hypothetical protein [Chitinophagaceae bacterium]HNE92868.1 hypothetical protein [Chitinophagaceae bacterium]HNM33562.1 hypothetical protein [Chitinophagaceae bacterium]
MKQILILFTFVALSFSSLAQGNKRGEKVQALKVAYMTQVLKLTPQEAQSFWPVYNTYFEESKKARMNNTNDELKYQEEALNIKKKYKPEFKKILNDESRANLVFKAERDFLVELQKEVKKRIQQRQKNKMKHNEFE